MSAFDRLGPKPSAAELLGWEYRGTSDLQQVLFDFLAREQFRDRDGFIHSGFLAAMLGEVIASTVTAAAGGETVGTMISMSVDFIRPVAAGPLAGKGAITLMGKNIAFVESSLFANEQLVARATGSCRLVPLDPFGEPKTTPELQNH